MAATTEVHLKDAEFHPSSVSILAGDDVLFINDDPYAHDVLFEAGFGTGASGTLASGANWSHTFDTNATYRYRCQVHSNDFQFGMVGSVVVGPPTPPRPKAPGFELLAAVCAVGVGALLTRRRILA